MQGGGGGADKLYLRSSRRGGPFTSAPALVCVAAGAVERGNWGPLGAQEGLGFSHLQHVSTCRRHATARRASLCRSKSATRDGVLVLPR